MRISSAVVANQDTRARTTMRELVEWTYADQKAHRGGEARVGPAGISQTGLVIDRLRLGCSIDKTPGGAQYWGQTYCDDDALVVHGVVERLPACRRSAIIQHGIGRTVPSWRVSVTPLRIIPVPGRKGAFKGIYDAAGNKIGHEVTYEGDLLTYDDAMSMRQHWPDAPRLRCIEDARRYAREVYLEWRSSLFELWRIIDDRMLRRWHVVDIGADMPQNIDAA